MCTRHGYVFSKQQNDEYNWLIRAYVPHALLRFSCTHGKMHGTAAWRGPSNYFGWDREQTGRVGSLSRGYKTFFVQLSACHLTINVELVLYCISARRVSSSLTNQVPGTQYLPSKGVFVVLLGYQQKLVEFEFAAGASFRLLMNNQSSITPSFICIHIICSAQRSFSHHGWNYSKRHHS